MIRQNQMLSSERMLSYYPEVIKQLLEFQGLIDTEGVEIDNIQSEFDVILNDAYLRTMSDERIVEWEKALGIPINPDESSEDRRDVIIARIRGQGKLNTALINNIVNAFTGGTAECYFDDSTLYVDITPPPDHKEYKFDNVERELAKKIPAHIALIVRRDYSTWGEITDKFIDWEAVMNSFATWEELASYVLPEEG